MKRRFLDKKPKMENTAMAERKTSVEIGADRVAVITILNPPLNLLSINVMLSLKESIELALQNDNVKALVIIGSNGTFSAGFDVTAFGKSQLKKKHQELGFMSIDFVTDTLEAARKPVVAAIDGHALGGGLEIALACHARISTASAQLGLPELQYGIIPGLGGTQRLPRLVGLAKSLEMMLMSKRLNGKDAQSAGLVDAIVPAESLLKTARQWVLDISECKKPWLLSLHRNDKIEELSKAREILEAARIQAGVRSPNVTYPLVCIDVIEEGIVSGPRNGLWKEVVALHELRQSLTCRSLVHFFFSKYQTTKIPGITDVGLKPNKVKKVAIIGEAFTITALVTHFSLNNFRVLFKLTNNTSVLTGITSVEINLQTLFNKGKISQEKLKKTISLLKCVLDYDSFGDVDLVIEAANGNQSLKQEIFADLKKVCPPHCMFASNASKSNLNSICESIGSHDRVVGTHFYSPVHTMPLMEIVRTEKTSVQVIVDLLDFAKRIKKTPILVKNCTGFAVDRTFFPYTQVAIFLVENGVDWCKIDRAITSFGMPIGPFRMIDHIGLEGVIASNNQFLHSFPQRSYKEHLLMIMQADKRDGQSTKKGFYIYDDEHKASPDPEIQKYIEQARRISRVTANPKLTKLSDGEIVEMLFFPVVNEAFRVIDEGIVLKESDLDIASVMGMGFPAYRGGIIFWAKSFGLKYICSRLENWSNEYGEFFKPCTYLLKQLNAEISLVKENEQRKSRL